MSRETLLDDAIAKAKEAEDWQLVEWLRMARGGESAARWYTAKLGEARLDMSKLMTENAKLREQVERLRTQLADMTESVGRVEERCAKTFEVGKRWMAKAARFEAENAKLREELADAPKCETCEAMLDCDECLRADGSHKERRRLSAENAKLREWCNDFWKWADPPFALKSGTFDEYMTLVERAVELGVEVNR